MKKLFRNIALCLIPVLLYFSLFIAFEPNNYFGLKKEAVSDDIMARLREYEKKPAANVIIGESRFAKFDMDTVSEITGREYCNLSYGGASFAEELDLLEWLINSNENLDTVVMGASFYTFNKAYSHDRMVIKSLSNPFRYVTNLTYNINMLEQVYISLYNSFNPDNKIERGGDNETMNPEDYVYTYVENPTGGEDLYMREDLAEYALKDLAQRTDNWSLNKEVLNSLYELNKICIENDVKLILVFSPMDDSVRRLVTEPGGIGKAMEELISQIRTKGISVIDHEFENPPNFSDNMFFDGFHLDIERGLPIYTEILFGEIKEMSK